MLDGGLRTLDLFERRLLGVLLQHSGGHDGGVVE